jgi:uncharacterized protein YyaL (SSP411 family)
MNKAHNRYFRMFNSVQTFLDENTALWSTIAILTGLKNELDEIIQRIRMIYDTNHDDSKAITREKNKLKDILCLKASIMAAALAALGEITDNENLKEYAEYSQSKLDKTTENDLFNIVANLINVSRAHLENLTNYGISENLVNELETSLDDTRELAGESRNIKNNVYANIGEADDLINAGRDLLSTKMDKVMTLYKGTQPKFYDLYKRSRVIVN